MKRKKTFYLTSNKKMEISAATKQTWTENYNTLPVESSCAGLIECPDGYWASAMEDATTDNPPGTCTDVNDLAQPICTAVNPAVCPNLSSNLPPDLTFFNTKPLNRWFANGTNDYNVSQEVKLTYKNFNETSVSCSYPLESFKTFGDIMNYQNAFTAFPSAFDIEVSTATLNQEIMPYFCSLPSTDCSIDPLKPGENVHQTHCSRFTSLDPEGTLCRTWAAEYPEESDVVQINYCHQPENLESSECACINKAYSPLYRAMKKDVNAPDSCWWDPCANASQFLVPSTELTVTHCQDVCTTVIANYGRNVETIDLQYANFFVSCTKGQPVPENNSSQPITARTSLILPQTTLPLFIWSYSMPWEYWFMIAILGVLVVLFLVLMFAIR
jgi:hypothetical protein